MTSATSDLLARARQTPLTRPAVSELAKVPGLDARAVAAALEQGEAHAATALAFACIAAEKAIEAKVMQDLLADVEATDLVGPLAHAAAAPPRDVLLGFLEDGRGSFERQALALLLIADALSGDRPPEAALRHARKLCRRAIDTETSVLLGGAAVRFGDRDLSTLAAEDVKRASRSKRAIEETLQKARRPALDVLGETSGPRVIAGDYTVRRDVSVGRNDACPCGSGKKYKKCCALKQETAALAVPRMQAASLHAEQVAALRPAELSKLDLSQLRSKAWVAAFHRALSLRAWPIAERMLETAEATGDLGPRLVDLRILLLHSAVEAQAREVAERAFAALPPEEQPFEDLSMAFLRNAPDLLDRLELAAVAALRDESDGAAAIELAYALLHARPGLGIFVARGAMHEGRVHDCQTLLDEMEDARDRLLLPAIEPWWDFYDNMIDAADDRDERIAKTEEQAKLARELRKARDEKRRATAELTKLREKLEELDARADAEADERAEDRRATTTRGGRGERKGAAAANDTSAAPGAAATLAAAELEEERRRLRTKVAELKRIVDEGQEERRELRKRLMQSADEDRDAPAASKTSGASSRRDVESDEAAERSMEEEGSVEEPRGVLVPRFSERAAKALRDLDGVAELVLSLVAGLAAGRPNAWSGTKQLKKVRGVLSGRAGIHHRILFRIDDGTLEVLEVIPRKDLEVTVTRLASR